MDVSPKNKYISALQPLPPHSCLLLIDGERRGGADLDIGGKDLGLVMSIGNTVANLPGVIVPAVGAWCRHRYASFAPLFAGVASLHLLAAVAFRLAKGNENARPR